VIDHERRSGIECDSTDDPVRAFLRSLSPASCFKAAQVILPNRTVPQQAALGGLPPDSVTAARRLPFGARRDGDETLGWSRSTSFEAGAKLINSFAGLEIASKCCDRPGLVRRMLHRGAARCRLRGTESLQRDIFLPEGGLLVRLSERLGVPNAFDKTTMTPRSDRPRNSLSDRGRLETALVARRDHVATPTKNRDPQRLTIAITIAPDCRDRHLALRHGDDAVCQMLLNSSQTALKLRDRSVR